MSGCGGGVHDRHDMMFDRRTSGFWKQYKVVPILEGYVLYCIQGLDWTLDTEHPPRVTRVLRSLWPVAWVRNGGS